MNQETLILIKKWHFRVCLMQIAHYDAATSLERKNLWFGIPVIVLSAFVGTTIFASISRDPDPRVQAIVGLLSVTAGVLASLQTFFRFKERAENHRMAGAKYSALKHELEIELVPPRKDESTMKQCLESLSDRRTAVHEESPTVSKRIIDKASKKAKSSKNELAEMIISNTRNASAGRIAESPAASQTIGEVYNAGT